MRYWTSPIALRLTVGSLLSLIICCRSAASDVKPGDSISPANAALVQQLVSPGTNAAVQHGMEMQIVAPQHTDWPPPYREATEKYSGQVRLSNDRREVLGYIAGQPFPILDANDPDIAVKIMWNSAFRPLSTDDFDLRFFECHIVPFNPGGETKMLEFSTIGHFAGYYDIGRTEVEPMPVDPNFKTTGIWFRYAAYPGLAPAEYRGAGMIRYRYWDANRDDNTWAYEPETRRMRRVSEQFLSTTTGMSTWDADHWLGFTAKSQKYDYKFLGHRQMLACVHARNSPAQPCPTDGGATACPDDWEMRNLYVVEVTPRPEWKPLLPDSKTIDYLDSEMWFNPYLDNYDQKGELWRTQVYLLTYRDRPVPDAKVAVYPFKREFVLAGSSIDVRTGMVDTCYLPGPNTPEHECWYINMGAVDRNFFTVDALQRAAH
jgi:hypothetical protein